MEPHIQKQTSTLGSIRWNAARRSLILGNGYETTDASAIAAWVFAQTEGYFGSIRSLPQEDRSDGASEARLKILRHMDDKDVQYLGGLVHKVCTQTMIDFYRRERLRRHEPYDDSTVVSVESEAQEGLLDRAVCSAIDVAARCLIAADRQRAAEYVMLRFGVGLTFVEIAARYECTEGAVRAATQRALELLKDDSSFREQVEDSL